MIGTLYNAQTGETTTIDIPNVEIPVDIEILKQNKIYELDTICNQTILKGFNSNAKGTIQHYDFSTDDQINMLGIQNRVFGAMLSNTVSTLIIEYKNSEQIVCDTDWTIPQFTQLCQEAETFKTNLIKKYHDLKVMVLESTTIDEVQAISW